MIYRFFLILLVSCSSTFVFAQASEYGICYITDQIKSKIETCQKKIMTKDCQEIPADLRKDCFSEYSQDDFNFAKTCAVDGSKKFIKDTYDEAKDLLTRAYRTVTDPKGYKTQVRTETAQACEKNRDVIEAKEKFEAIKKNIGADMAFQLHFKDMQNVVFKCYRDEERKGTNLGIDISIPDFEQLASTLSCMKAEAQTEFGCSVVMPSLVSGGYSGVKALLNKRLSARAAKIKSLSSDQLDLYISKIKDKLTPAEAASLRHQEDLLEALANPDVLKKIGLSEVEAKSLVQGIIDSDAGKLSVFKKYLTTASPDSDLLLNVVKGADSSSPAGQAFQQFMAENKLTGQGLLNKDISNEQLRKLFADSPVAQGYLHEIPGLVEAIKDVNLGRITPAEFKKRLGANLFHNGPHAGFWEMFADKVVPMALKDSQYNDFFKNTVFAGDTLSTGFTKPRYPSPITKEGFIHTNFDRLSQATSGGNKKIFLEIHNGSLKDNPKLPLKDLKGPNGDGLGTLKSLLIGDGTPSSSSALRTVQQFDVDSKGNVLKVNLKDSNGNFLGLITKDTPADEAQKLMEKFYAHEEAFNGHPFKDLMKPRLLSPSEKILYGVVGSSPAYYCNSQKFKNGARIQRPAVDSQITPASTNPAVQPEPSARQ